MKRKFRDVGQLIDTASAIFGQKGFDDTNLEDVAAALSMDRSSLYYHVASKADLFALVQIQRVSLILEQLECIANSHEPARQKLKAAVHARLLHADRFYPESRSWMDGRNGSSHVSDERRRQLDDMHERIERIFCDIVQEGIAAGQFAAECDPQVAALAVLGMCNSLSRWYRREGRLSIDEIADTFVHIAVDGLSSPSL